MAVNEPDDCVNGYWLADCPATPRVKSRAVKKSITFFMANGFWLIFPYSTE
jgi:hypothetical protein